MAKSLIPCSEEEYYYKLDNTLICLCEFLRKYFQEKWKSETNEEWKDENEYKMKFLDGTGKSIFKKAPSFQKGAFLEHPTDEWDLPLLSLLIQNIGDEKKYDKQNKAILKLKTLRNELAHHTTKKISKDDYSKKVCVFRESVLTLGMSQQDIETLINKAGVSSSKKAKKRMKDILVKAKTFLETKQPEKAIQCCTDAIAIPSLLPKHIATAYEERANCFLSMMKNHNLDQRHVSSALVDSVKALDLNEQSWMAHYLTAQCYRLQSKLSNAVKHYERALSISPGQAKVKADLDSCKSLIAKQQRREHLNPKLVMNLEERVAHFNNETGNNINQTTFLNLNLFEKMDEFIKGQSDVFRGHQYFNGWNVPQNYEEAARYYAKASEMKNLEGMYNLAMCYRYGNGVTQDIPKALKMYRELAEMDVRTPGEFTQTKCNVGVAFAQHSIGLMYDDGVGVKQNRREAAIWYTRAMGNGSGYSANNLGIMYHKGEGVEQDIKMAEMCWKQAVNLKDYNAAHSLFGYYIEQLEPDLALEMVKTGQQMGNSELLKMSKRDLQTIIDPVRRLRASKECEIFEFEKEHKLESKGRTFKERLTRVEKVLNPGIVKFQNVVHNVLHKINSGKWGGKAHPLNWFTILKIQERAKNGSITASKIMHTLWENIKLTDMLDQNEEFTETQKLEIIDTLYNCASMEFHLVRMTPDQNHKLTKLVGKMFESYCNKKNVDDSKIRFCYVAFNLEGSVTSDDKYSVEILKDGVSKYPDNLHYYELLVCFLGFKGEYKEGIIYAEEGVRKFPKSIELQYFLAVHLRLAASEEANSATKAIAAYKKFLGMAPMDHRKYPEACYQISLMYIKLHRFDDNTEKQRIGLAKEYYFKGNQAEKHQFECYLPYAESDVKNLIEAILEMSSTSKRINGTNESISSQNSMDILERKPYLNSPSRKAMINHHRKLIAEVSKRNKNLLTTLEPKLCQPAACVMSNLKPITLQEMNPTEDYIFESRFLELTIIDDPNPYFISIHLIAEDINGDTTRLYLYNIDKTPKNLDKVRAGCRLAIINPYMRIGAQDITHGIRNDEPKCIIYLSKLENMCRFCGVENAKQKCSKCKRHYCSRECQVLDWEEFNHKIICKVRY